MKKRYYLSLTQETVEEFQEVAKSLGMPPVTLSLVCDDCIAGVLKTLKAATEKGSFSAVDMIKLMAEQLDRLDDIKTKNIVNT